jgi:hypothetical protein
MVSLGLSIGLFVLTLLSRMAFDEAMQIVSYALILGALVLNILRQGRLTNLGAFLLLAFILYGVRPLFILVEDDRELIYSMMGRVPILPVVARGMFTAVIAMLTICVGHAAAKIQWPLKNFRSLPGVPMSSFFPKPTPVGSIALIGFQVLCLVFLFGLRSRGLSIYGDDAGAYSYLFPQVLQAGQIFPLVVFAYNKNKCGVSGQVYFWISLVLFALFTFFMKDLSMFRSFYLTGAISAVIAILHAQRGRVAYWILVLPVLYLLPAFRALGETRLLGSEEAFAFALDVMRSFSFESWWEFFNAKGDMNVFDTLAAAVHSTPRFYPYFQAWFYAVAHFIPRAWWPGKPDRGMLVDMAFAQGAPLSPGLAGFYYLDGGFLWMLLSCFLTGMILYALDRWLIAMRPGYLRSSLFGIIVINSLYAARGYLHFTVIQYIFMLVPVFLLSWAAAKLRFIPEPKFQRA